MQLNQFCLCSQGAIVTEVYIGMLEVQKPHGSHPREFPGVGESGTSGKMVFLKSEPPVSQIMTPFF